MTKTIPLSAYEDLITLAEAFTNEACAREEDEGLLEDECSHCVANRALDTIELAGGRHD